MKKGEIGDKLREARKETYYYYGSEKRMMGTKIFAKTEFLAKKMRQMWIRSGDMTTHKHVIPIKRMRTREDTLFKMMQNGELAGVIEGREEFPDIDFVVDKQFTKRLDG